MTVWEDKAQQSLIIVGKIAGAFGVRGWVRLESYTDPTENLFYLQPLWLIPHPEVRPIKHKHLLRACLESSRTEHKTILFEDRSAAYTSVCELRTTKKDRFMPIIGDSKQALSPQIVHVTASEQHKHGWVAKFSECDDRDLAIAWRGAYLKVAREELPALPENEYYWVDLEGMQVHNLENHVLGRITHLVSTGANDIIAVKQDQQERYIPFLRPDVVKEIDLAKGIMIVDWDVDF